MSTRYDRDLKAKLRWKLQTVKMKTLMNLYYTHFITCNAFADLAAVVEEEKLRKFVIKAFLKEFTLNSLEAVIKDAGIWTEK